MGITEISLVPKRAGGTRLGSRILFPGCGAVFPGHGRLLRVEAVFTGSGARFPVSENFISFTTILLRIHKFQEQMYNKDDHRP